MGVLPVDFVARSLGMEEDDCVTFLKEHHVVFASEELIDVKKTKEALKL